MHEITGYFFTGKWVIYSTLYKTGRYVSIHDRTGLTEQQARGKFILEHSREVDHLLTQERKQQSKIILNS